MKKHLIVVPALACALMMFSPLASAQDDEPMWSNVRTHHVKSGAGAEYVELMKQMAAAMKAAGRPSRDVWQEIRGDLNTFHIVTRANSLADFDAPFEPPMGEEAWAAWLSGIADVVESSTLMILRRHPEFSIPAAEGEEPNLLILRYRTLRRGASDEYHDWVENQLSPALAKGGATGVTWSHIVFGGNNRTWIGASMVENWSEMAGDGPLSYLSDEEQEALLSPANEMEAWGENRVLRYRTDLSYSAE